jgi:hypothetical protein
VVIDYRSITTSGVRPVPALADLARTTTVSSMRTVGEALNGQQLRAKDSLDPDGR